MAEGMFDRLLSDPYALNMALNGLGLLGSKRQSQSQFYSGNISKGLLQQAQTKAQQARDAETKRVNNSIIGYNTARAEDLANPGLYQGTGAEASSLNIVATLGAKKRQGLPLTQAEEIQLQTAQGYLGRSRTAFGPGGQPIEQAGMNFDYLNQNQSQAMPPVDLSDIPSATIAPQQQGGDLLSMGYQQPPAPRPAITAQAPTPPQLPPQTPAPQVFPATPAQIKTDELTAAEYVDWTTKGEAVATKNISQLMSAREALKSGKVETGDWKAFLSSLMPDKVVSYVRPEFMDTKEQVQEVVQANLTATLGSQFAEREGDRVIARAYNENVGTELNVQRVDRLINQIVQTTDAKKKAMDYYGKNGTMVGYSADINSMADLQKKLEADFLAGIAEDNAGESEEDKELRMLKEEFGIQ